MALVRSSVLAVLQSDSWPICEKAIFTSANAEAAVKTTASERISANILRAMTIPPKYVVVNVDTDILGQHELFAIKEFTH